MATRVHGLELAAMVAAVPADVRSGQPFAGMSAMSAQLPLVAVPATPKLTGRQAHALALLQEAGSTGMQPAVLGALMHDWAGSHPVGRPCGYCVSAGNELLRALRRKGVAKLRRLDGRMVWQAVDMPSEDSFGEIPY